MPKLIIVAITLFALATVATAVFKSDSATIARKVAHGMEPAQAYCEVKQNCPKGYDL